MFQQSKRRFANARAKPFLRFIDDGYPSTLRALESCQAVPTIDVPQLVADRLVSPRRFAVIVGTQRPINRLMHEREREGNSGQAVLELRGIDTLVRQMDDGTHTDPFLLGQTMLSWALANQRRLGIIEPGLFTEAETQQLEARHSSSWRVQELVRKASEEVFEPSNSLTGSSALLTIGFGLVAASVAFGTSLMPWLVVVAVVSFVAAFLFRRTRPESAIPLGIGRHVLVWFVSLAVSIVALGMVPAGIFSDTPLFGPAAWKAATDLGLSGQKLASSFKEHKLVWTMLQWSLFQGPAVCFGFAETLLAAWVWLRSRRDGEANAGWKYDAASTVARSSATGALLVLMGYVAVGPSLTQSMDRDYYERLKQTDSDWQHAELTRAEIALQADPEFMQQVEDRVAEVDASFVEAMHISIAEADE